MNASFVPTVVNSGSSATKAPAAEADAPLEASLRRRLGLKAPLRFGWLLGPILAVVLWAIGSAVGFIDSRTLPAPWVAVSTAVDLVQQGRLQHDVAVSAWRAIQGLVWGVTLGVIFALLSGLTLVGGYLIDGLVQIKRAIPSLALIPLFVLWFGIGETMKVIVVALGVFIPIYIHTHNALRAIDIKHVELAESLGMNHAQFIRHVVLPGALPGLLLGLRFGVMGAWLGLVVVEQMNATSGIGYMITLARTYAQSDIILVGLVVYAVLGVSSDLAVRFLESRVLSWRLTLAK